MGKEIERKYLVRGEDWRKLAKGVRYRQGYLSTVKERTVRVRTVDDKGFLTIKGMRGHSYEAVEIGLGIIASGKYPLREMATHVFGLGEVDLALRTVGGEGAPDAIHCAIDPWR